jgi:hypothetical protein
MSLPIETPPTQPAERNIWEEAYQLLNAKQQASLEVVRRQIQDPRIEVNQVLQAANSKKDECLKKRWKISLKGRTIILRDVLEKVEAWVNKFIASTPYRGENPKLIAFF